MNPMSQTSHDLFLFHEGSLFQSYRMLGAHLMEHNGESGVRFCVWAPNAAMVKVVGDFNSWNGSQNEMRRLEQSGLWSLFIPYLGVGTVYKYEIHTAHGQVLLKSDPYAFYSELRPQTASVVYALDRFQWEDEHWRNRSQSTHHQPMLIYEVHFGSWKLKDDLSFYDYQEIAEELINYVVEMGYSHIEFLPLAEHPYDRSWGYQITGYYSVTSRYGTPEQFMYLVNRCHQRGIGVIMDWVPGHFCRDDHGLRLFDGSPLYEYADLNKADKQLWGTLSFDFGRPEVICFLISNALFWMDKYHIDGLRVDAVASMMELNFDKPAYRWTLNANGGTENLEAKAFVKKLNETVFHYYPQALMIAEDSSDKPLISAPVYAGGMGFNYKWNMGWMNDTLRYMQLELGERRHHHHLITFSLCYAFSENFVLPLSHDEVVHGKKSLLDKMPGDYWRKFANLRLLYAFMITHPGKKLLFMGGEWGQFAEWKDLEQVDWLLADFEMHRKMKEYVKQLNHFYQREPALWKLDHDPAGFEWIDADNNQQSIVSFMRKSSVAEELIVVVCNFGAEVYHDYRIGVPMNGRMQEVLNSDWEMFGGSGQKNGTPIEVEAIPVHNQKYSIRITVPPLAAVMFKRISAEISPSS